MRQHVNLDQIPDLPEFKGEHLWIIITAHWVTDPTQTVNVLLDRENLLTVEGPGCYWCEEPYSPRIAHRRCKEKK